MDRTVRTPPFIGPDAAIGLTAGMLLCLWSPALMPRAFAYAALVLGLLLMVVWRRRVWLGMAVLGLGWATIIAGNALLLRLPAALEGQDVLVSGRVAELPVAQPDATRFVFEVEDSAANPAPLRGRRLRLGWYAPNDGAVQRVEPGSRWRLSVRLKRPHGLRNPGVLDSERGAFVNRIAATGSVRSGSRAIDASPSGLDAQRDAISRHVDAAGGRGSAYIRALAVGDTRGLTDADWRVLRAAGLTHLIAISGSHVALTALVGAAAAWVLWWLVPALGVWVPRRIAMAVAGVVIAAGYAALAGSEVPTLRTLLMMVGLAGAIVLRRRLGVAQALSVAAICLALVDPLNLLRPGFWLSFCGVAWLAWCLRDGGRGRVREFLVAQAVATAGLLPLSMLFFAQASWVSPIANLIAVPLWGMVVVPLSLLGVLGDLLHSGWGDWPWQLGGWIFAQAWPLFEWLAGLPLSQSRLPEPVWFALPLALLGAFWLLGPRALPGKPLALALWLPMFTATTPAPLPGEARIEVLDVGQGLSVLVRTSSHAWLYDTGPAMAGGFDAGRDTVVPALAALGVSKLDGIMLSHGDNDHAGGAPAVIAVYPGTPVQAPEGAPVQANSACHAGQAWAWDGVRFEVVWPEANTPYKGNASSCVVRVSTRGGAVLLTGDIDSASEKSLALQAPQQLAADIVLMPHHGSGGSSSRELIEASRAREAVASAGYRNRYRHPNPKALERWQAAGVRIHDTPHEGALAIELKGGQAQVVAERSRRARLWDGMH